MSTKKTDPLLGGAKLIVVLAQILIVLMIVGIGIGIGVLVTVGREEVLSRIAAAGAPSAAFAMLILSFAQVVALLMLAHQFFRQLGGIIDTVGAGEPFAIENAGRLSRMGWISVAAHALGLVLAGMAAWFHPYLVKLSDGDPDARFDFGFGLDGGAILLTLILFILARVFREGARMRDELEGTV
jgi:hypothetical protein